MIKDPELLKLAVKAIEAEPFRWDQGSWAYGRPKDEGTITIQASVPYGQDFSETRVFGFIDLESEVCGTTMCLAGHIVTQAGFPILIDLDKDTRETLEEWPQEGVDAARCLVDGQAIRVEDKARELLGINTDQAHRIFAATSLSLPEFKERLTEVTGVEFE